jgi:hypothetical protein
MTIDTAVPSKSQTQALAEPPDCRCGSVMEYADLLGHDRVGHLAHNVLAAAGYVRVSEVAVAADAELRMIRNMGDAALARVRERIPQGATPVDRYTPTVLMHRLPDGLAMQPWMYVEPDKAAALWCLTAFAHDDKRVWPHVHERAIRFSELLPQTWIESERVLLNAARSLYTSHRVGVDLSELARRLTDDQWHVLLEAMRIRRDGSRSAR